MALQLTRTSILCRMTRQFYRNGNNTARCMSTNTPKTNENPNDIHTIGTYMHNVSDFDRWLLAWVKRYPSKAEVPKQVTRDCILQARSKGRIRACNIMIAISLVSFLIAVFSGKKDAAQGKSLHNKSQEWYKELRREHEAEQAALAAKAKQE